MKPAIKHALMVAFTFFVLSIVATLLSAMLFMVYMLCTHVVSGQSITSFDSVLFVEGMLSSAPFVMLASAMFMILYMIRHPYTHWLPLTVYAVLYTVAWLLFIPAVFSLENHFDEQGIVSNVEYGHLSPDYFRNSDGLVFYYSQVQKDNLANGVCIDLTDSYGKVYSFSNVRLPGSNGDFIDSLVKSAVGMSPVMSAIMKCLENLADVARLSILGGYLRWITFATIGLALMSVVGLRRVSRWRLVNVAFVVAFSVFIFVFNVFCYTSSPISGAVSFMNGYLSKVFPMANPFAFLCNIVLAFALGLTGLLIDIIHGPEEDPEGGTL